MIRAWLEPLSGGSTYGSRKVWAVAEIEHDIIDVAINVARALEEGRKATVKAINDLSKHRLIP